MRREGPPTDENPTRGSSGDGKLYDFTILRIYDFTTSAFEWAILRSQKKKHRLGGQVGFM